jgi:hypothetical protein|tara:strand:- start:265 stop:510 length:246 start_codon:yes stop_codon:yes gene_type:complete
MKIRCFKKSGSGNVRVDSPNKADLISVSKDDASEEQMQAVATHFSFRGDIRESASGESWNVYKVPFTEYAPTFEFDLGSIK